MTERRLFLFAFALPMLWMFTGCQTAHQPEPTRDVAADTAALNALRSQYAAALNSSDAAAAAACYADDAIVMEPNQAAIEGKRAIQASVEAMFKTNKVTIALTPLETQVAGDWAYDRGNYTFTFTPRSGKPTEESGKYLVILKRLPDGSWKVYRDMVNSNNPPPAAVGKKK